MRKAIWAAHARTRKRREFDKALDDCQEAIRLDPNDASSDEVRSEIYGIMGVWDKALGDCDEAIRLNPRLANPYNYRAHVHSKREAWDKMILDCDEALRRDPQNAFAYASRGHAYAENPSVGQGLRRLSSGVPAQAEKYHVSTLPRSRLSRCGVMWRKP